MMRDFMRGRCRDVAEFAVFDFGDAFGVGVVAVVKCHQLVDALAVACGVKRRRMAVRSERLRVAGCHNAVVVRNSV